MVWKNSYVKNKKGRSIAEQLLTLRNIIEQCTEWNSTLFDNYVDSEQEFDSIPRESLWSIQMVRIVKLHMKQSNVQHLKMVKKLISSG